MDGDVRARVLLTDEVGFAVVVVVETMDGATTNTTAHARVCFVKMK
jgi:hypothetical protein